MKLLVLIAIFVSGSSFAQDYFPKTVLLESKDGKSALLELDPFCPKKVKVCTRNHEFSYGDPPERSFLATFNGKEFQIRPERCNNYPYHHFILDDPNGGFNRSNLLSLELALVDRTDVYIGEYLYVSSDYHRGKIEQMEITHFVEEAVEYKYQEGLLGEILEWHPKSCL